MTQVQHRPPAGASSGRCGELHSRSYSMALGLRCLYEDSLHDPSRALDSPWVLRCGVGEAPALESREGSGGDRPASA